MDDNNEVGKLIIEIGEEIPITIVPSEKNFFFKSSI